MNTHNSAYLIVVGVGKDGVDVSLFDSSSGRTERGVGFLCSSILRKRDGTDRFTYEVIVF